MNPSIVLVRPLFSGNLGSVARAMKNMGLKDLRLVAPQAAPRDFEAQKMAAHAKDLLKSAKIFSSLPDAVKGFHLIVGTSRRKGKERGNWTEPRAFATALSKLPARQKVAILFGAEDSGLSNEEVTLCQRMICIPSHAGFGSLNLAQAVMVVAYECFLATLDGKKTPNLPAEERPSRLEHVEGMYADLKALLGETGFLDKHNPEHLMRLIRNLFNRAHPTEREVRIVRGICRQVRWWGKG